MEYIAYFLVLTIIIIILFYFIEYLINKFREYNMVKKYSGPKSYPVIGNLNLFLGDSKDITDSLLKLISFYSSPLRFWIGTKLIIVFDDPENIRILSRSSYGYEKNRVYDFFHNYVGNGLFTAPVSLWEIHRRILNPLFKEKVFSTYMDSIVKNSDRLSNALQNTNGENVDVKHYVHLCTLDIIYESLLGTDLNLQSDSDCKLDEHMAEVLDIIFIRFFKFWLHPNIIFNNSSIGKRQKKLLSQIHKITDEIIRKKKESIRENNFTEEGIDPNARKITSMFLDVIFKSFYETGEYSESNIYDEVNTMVLAGSDTSGGILEFLFLMLATYPDIQKQAYEELYDIYGSSDPKDVPIKLEDVKNMKYLERAIKETLRLFPSVVVIGRTLMKDTKVNDNLVIPKNCQVFFSIFTLHRKEKYWREPLRFNPDRFLPGRYNPKCFIPFSLGKRGCIGQEFAMLELKTITATILRKFIIRIDNPVSAENIGLKLSITLRPVETILLRFIRR